MVVRMRSTRSHTGNRRSHHGLKAPQLSVCKNCGAHHRPHHMCLECGFYKGRQVLDLEAKKQKREARMQAKRDALKAQMGNEPGNEAKAASQAEAPEAIDEKQEK